MHIGILHEDRIPREYFEEFEAAIRVEGLELDFESYPSGSAYASLEWLVPSAIVAFLAKPYFEAFLSEMGKDHYALLKKALVGLYSRVAGPDAPEVKGVGTTGKVRESQPYSLLFSVVAEATANIRFKLLVPRPVTQDEYELLVSEFLQFMDRIHSGTLDERTRDAFQNTTKFGTTVLVQFDPVEKLIVPVDPTQGRSKQ